MWAVINLNFALTLLQVERLMVTIICGGRAPFLGNSMPPDIIHDLPKSLWDKKISHDLQEAHKNLAVLDDLGDLNSVDHLMPGMLQLLLRLIWVFNLRSCIVFIALCCILLSTLLRIHWSIVHSSRKKEERITSVLILSAQVGFQHWIWA